MKGIDYAFGAHPAPAAVKAAGYGFACRYMSAIAANDTNGKNLVAAELHALLAAGLAVVVVEESTAGRMKGGAAAGLADGAHALAVTGKLGIAGIPVYFACDFDAAESDQPAISAYLDAAATIIGHARTGIYGGFYPVKRSLDGGHAAWAWQASAWSGGQWDPRAHIRQHGTVSVGGVTVDFDEAMKADFGQWPRPVTAPAMLPAPATVSVTQLVNASWAQVTHAGQPVARYRVEMAHGTPASPGAPFYNELVDGTHLAGIVIPGGPVVFRVKAADAGIDGAFTPWKAVP